MRNAVWVCAQRWLFHLGFLAAAVLNGGGAGCSRRSLHEDGGVDSGQVGSGRGGSSVGGGAVGGGAVGGGAVGGSVAGGTGGGPGTTGTGGAGGPAAACAGAADPRLVLADQRILRLTATEVVNTVRYLIGDPQAAWVTDGIVTGNDVIESQRRFPPLEDQTIDSSSFPALDQVATRAGVWVSDNFVAATGCSPATDACATDYLDALAAKAYRRRLEADERDRFHALYTKLRTPQTVNGYLVAFTIAEATSFAVDALLRSPQMVWRWEIGDVASASTGPAGIPLTDQELATQLSFFLTDQPPDANLLAAANGGTLRANLAGQVDRLLASQPARDWLRTIMETYFRVNTLPRVSVDPNQFPLFTQALAADMGTETRKFLDQTLWSGSLTDLLLSRTAFVNTSLAANIYGITVPTGASSTNFVQTTLPSAQRSGLLTNPGFLAASATFDGRSLVVPRGLLVDTVLLCMPRPPSAPSAPANPAQTGQEQVAARAAQPTCSSCHAQFDAYGLALENYDNIGRYRMTDGSGQTIDAHAMLPAVAGGRAVANAVDMAQELAASPAFTNCMARVLLKYAMVDPETNVEVPLAPQQAGCATADLVQRYQSRGGSTFADLVRATAASPAFVLRRTAP